MNCFRKLRGLPAAVLLVFLALPTAASAQAQHAATYFRQNCMNCHTVGGGRLTGPDLKDVSKRQDRQWLVHFLQNPKAVIDSGDPYATRLRDEARGVLMPALPGMNPQLANELLDLLEAESTLPRSQFAGVQISDRPFTAADIEKGRLLFRGQQRLNAGGPSCISCHTVKGIGGLGGGRLGPDLTLVYERLQGRKGLGAWLSNPASPTMAPVFKNKALTADEILPLLAVFEDSAKQGGQDDSAAILDFFLLGLGVMVVGLVSFDAIWKKRLRGVRQWLVRKGKEGEE